MCHFVYGRLIFDEKFIPEVRDLPSKDNYLQPVVELHQYLQYLDHQYYLPLDNFKFNKREVCLTNSCRFPLVFKRSLAIHYSRMGFQRPCNQNFAYYHCSSQGSALTITLHESFSPSCLFQ